MENDMTFQQLTNEMMRLYSDGRYVDAYELVERNADHFLEQSARTTFWKMCLLSLCGRSSEVISVFQHGLDSGLWWADSQFQDTDLDAVRDLPQFKSLMSICHEKYEDACKQAKPDQTILLPDVPALARYPLLVTLHGRGAHKDSDAEYWDVARRRGWLVLSVQSTQPLSPDSYCWDDVEQGLADILSCVDTVSKQYPMDPLRLITAGFSQGSGMAIYASLSGKVGARGFISVGTFIADPASLVPLARQVHSVRGYFVTGEKDRTLDKARAIQKILKENSLQFEEEAHPDLGHEFPPDFEASFDKAIDFIFKETV